MKVTVPLLSALAIAACASVSITNQWKDPAWQGPAATHVLVIGVSRSDTTRRLFEDTFVRDLAAAGVTASASYASIPSGGDGSAKLGDVVRNSGSDAVLVTRVQRVEDRINVTPTGPGYGGFYGWYGGAWASTPEVTQTTLVTLETSIWDPRSEKLVWTVTTRGVASSDIPRVTQQLSSTLIPRLRADGIIR